jgi:hypothetical protein
MHPTRVLCQCKMRGPITVRIFASLPCFLSCSCLLWSHSVGTHHAHGSHPPLTRHPQDVSRVLIHLRLRF